ncbi:MAG: PqqD family protein [Lachnospiraceae bacterium]|nr:PqqD family protein [Lachnospiraceae bacterium]
MKIKGTFVTRNIAGDTVIVPVGETALAYNGMITTTRTGAVIWAKLEEGAEDKEVLLQAVLDRFEVDRATAEKDLDAFLEQLDRGGFLEK